MGKEYKWKSNLPSTVGGKGSIAVKKPTDEILKHKRFGRVGLKVTKFSFLPPQPKKLDLHVFKSEKICVTKLGFVLVLICGLPCYNQSIPVKLR